MKKISIIILCFVGVYSCSSGGGPEPNTAPTVPSLKYPTNNLVCVNSAINFQWNASTDAQNDVIKYRLEISTDNTFPPQNTTTSTTTLLNTLIALEKGVSYYWRIKATDSNNDSSGYSEIFNFYTEGDGVVNYLPFAPVLVSPANESIQTNNSIELNWTAEDADVDDVLVYDLYFDMANPPVNKVATSISANSFTVNAANIGTYYWKVDVKDDKGGSTIGQVWNFVKE